MIAISACSDWTEYAKRREEGGWEQEKAAILASASATTATGQTQSTATSQSTSPASSTPDAHTETAPASPLSAYNYLSTLSSAPCYLAFSPNGSWSAPAYIVTGFSGGKMKLTAVENEADDFPSNAFPFRVSSNPVTPGGTAATFAIQNEAGEYLSWTSTDGFGWQAGEGADTQFSTNNFYFLLALIYL